MALLKFSQEAGTKCEFLTNMWIMNTHIGGGPNGLGIFFFHFWEDILLYIISYFFENNHINFSSFKLMILWYRCFQCWPPFPLLCYPSPLFSFPFMLAGHGEMCKFNICCIFIMDTQSLLLNKWTRVHRKSKKYSIVTKS